VARPLLFTVTTMEEESVQILNLSQARRALTRGDIKSDVAFQHDVNRLLASLEDLCDAAECADPSRD
jgi:hypothetical protein